MSDLQFEQVANIKVFGIGGGGCNAVNRMVSEGVKGVEFYVANTDLQALNISPVENKIVLGREVTKGLGAGANPEMGRRAAQENENEIREAIKGSDMVFITTGLGGGTGTGAAPMFAKIAKEEGALTVGIVTKPFTFEGKKRMKSAEDGLAELKQYVDSLIIVSNNNLIEVIGRQSADRGLPGGGQCAAAGCTDDYRSDCCSCTDQPGLRGCAHHHGKSGLCTDWNRYGRGRRQSPCCSRKSNTVSTAGSTDYRSEQCHR